MWGYMLRTLAILLVLSSSLWAELPDAPTPQPSPRPLFTYRYQERFDAIPSRRFSFDPIFHLEHSPHRVPRAMGRVWAFQNKHYDPNPPSMRGVAPMHTGARIRRR